MYFRRTVNDEDQRHYYLKDSSGLCPCYSAPDVQRLILTESVMDAATYGVAKYIKPTISWTCYGTNGLTAEHEVTIRDLSLLCYISVVIKKYPHGKQNALTW
jgi:hypothetical protein